MIAQRDILDSTREISPLTKADDAVEIDTSDLTIQQQVEMILQLAEQKISSSCWQQMPQASTTNALHRQIAKQQISLNREEIYKRCNNEKNSYYR